MKIGIFQVRFIMFPLVESPKICWTVKLICALSSAFWLKWNSSDQVWDRGRKDKIANSKETSFVTPIFSAFKWSAGRFHKLQKFWEVSVKQIEENPRQSQIITGEHLPSCSLSLITKIISITSANNSPNLACCLLIAFSDLQKWKHQNLFKTHYADACLSIEQKPCGASLEEVSLFLNHWFGFKIYLSLGITYFRNSNSYPRL